MMPPTKGSPSKTGGAFDGKPLLINRSVAIAKIKIAVAPKYRTGKGKALIPTLRSLRSGMMPEQMRAELVIAVRLICYILNFGGCFVRVDSDYQGVSCACSW